jgi:cyanuric acid amidohydrolase
MCPDPSSHEETAPPPAATPRPSMVVELHTLGMADPADVSGLARLIDDGVVDPACVVASIGKTEGNGGANDFTRALATRAVADLLGGHLGLSRPEVEERVALVWSGGCEGVLSPHMTVVCRRWEATDPPHHRAAPAGQPPTSRPLVGRLAVSVQRTRPIAPEEVGRRPQIEEVAAAVRRARAEIGAEPDDVHYVQVKGPLLTPAGIADAARRGVSVATEDPNRSKAYARGATALGVALALGEVSDDQVDDDMVAVDLDRWSAVASTSAGGELTACEIVLFANSEMATGRLRSGHAVLRDPVDLDGVRAALRSAGLDVSGDPDHDQRQRIAAIFAKAEAPVGGRLHGQRTTMLSDADIGYERHARAALGAVICSQTGDPRIFVSGGTEHQAPPGQAPIAAIVDVGTP